MKLISNKSRSRVNALGIFGYIIYKLGKIAKLKRVYHWRYGRWFVYRPLKSDLEVIVSVHNGEFEAVPLPKSADSKASLIVDAGGHIGMSAVFFATSWPNFTVAVIEPDYENYCMLQENVAPYDNIIPIHAALVPEKFAGDMVELFDRGTGPWGYSIVRQADSSAPRTFVPSVSLESILKGLPNFETIALLKLDIEGAEKALFEHDQNRLQSVDLVIAELHDRILPGTTSAFDKCFGKRKIERLGPEKVLVTR